MTDTEREEFLERLCETIVNGMPLIDLRNIVWDQIYNELISLGDSDLELFAEDYEVEM